MKYSTTIPVIPILLFQVTYKALEQFSESDFDLEKLEKTVHHS